MLLFEMTFLNMFLQTLSNGHYKLLKNPLYAKLINDFFKQKFKAIEMHIFV